MTEISAPDFRVDPLPLGPISGDHNDDDGRAIDEAYEAADWGPQEYGGIKVEREDLPPTTRIINVAYTLDNTQGPVMFLPPDRNRKNVTIYSPTSIVFAYGSERNDVESFFRLNGAAAGFTAGPNTSLTIGDHTGALWIATSAAAPGGMVVASAVTL